MNYFKMQLVFFYRGLKVLPVFFLVLQNFTYSQQLIIDGGFENGLGGMSTTPPDWITLQGTPDNCESTPGFCNSWVPLISSASPDGGRWQRFFRHSFINERFGQYLCSPLIAGQSYTLEFWVSHSTLNGSSGPTNTSMELGFSVGPPTTSNVGTGNYSVLPINTPNNWQLISISFVANGNYDFISFGINVVDWDNSLYIDGVSLLPNSSIQPNAGANSVINTCNYSTSFNLFDFLGGTPDPGGTWYGPSNLSGGHLGTFNPLIDATGIYTYEITSPIICNVAGTSASANVTVNSGNANASWLVPATICSSDPPLDLSSFITGTTGGTFSGSGISGNIFDPSSVGVGTHVINYGIAGPCGDSQNGIISVSNCSLPIELSSFEVRSLDRRRVGIYWTTESELNNEYFTIERSTDGISFNSIAKVTGAKNSSTRIDYFNIDKSPHSGTSYYRLKQTDVDGTFSYSNIATFYLSEDQEITIYPNPAKEFITIKMNLTGNKNISVIASDGKLVKEIKTIKEEILIPLNEIEVGTYILQIESTERIDNKILIKGS